MNPEQLKNFHQKLVKNKWEPSVEKSIDRIENNIDWWTKYQDYAEHIQEIFQIIAFISVFFNYKVLTGASIAIAGALNRGITNSIKKQNELKSERKSIYHDIGVDKYLPHPSTDEENKV